MLDKENLNWGWLATQGSLEHKATDSPESAWGREHEHIPRIYQLALGATASS